MTKPMHGIVLCAGLGTRLRPLTQILPKPVVPVGILPAALKNAEQLLNAGIHTVHLNTHYLAEEVVAQVKEAAQSRSWPAHAIRFWHEPEILETGGGIARIVQQYSAELQHSKIWDTLIVSGDIVADVPIDPMMQRWKQRKPEEASLMASVPLTVPRTDVTWVSPDLSYVSGFGTDFSAEQVSAHQFQARIFSNHQIISGRLLQGVEVKKRSSIDLFYRASLLRGEKILHVPFGSQASWFDIGTPESYIDCANKLNLNSNHIQSISNQKILFVDHQPQGVITLDYSSMREASHEQSGLSSPRLQGWQWLGHIHVCPALLKEPILEHLERIHLDVGREPHSGKFNVSVVDGQFLSQDSRHTTQAHDSPVNGFFDLEMIRTASLKTKLPHPVLVRLDSLIGTSQTKNGSGRFWILIH
jgi:NDP-sugar pyrophosphorylase family protein